MMRYLIGVCFLLLVHCSLGLLPNSKQNFCQQNRCLTCVGRYCTTTCQGECKNCPLGDCCDGTKCNICRGETCCKTPECNACVNTCLKQCQGKSTCHFDCFQQCIPSTETTKKIQEHRFPVFSSRNYLPVNVSTIINITNTINNQQSIHNPIYVNTTNINNKTVTHHGNYHRKQVIINNNNNPFTNHNSRMVLPKKFNCCEIIHPEVCQKIPNVNDLLCFRRKHRECSLLCTSKYVHIVESEEETNKCITIVVQPHYYCGKYRAENCDSCYDCPIGYECDNIQSSCSHTCKTSIIPKDFYNKLYRKRN